MPAKTRFDPFHQSQLRAEIARQLQCLQRDAADARRAHLQEQPHLGVAEQVDGLHGIADEEQRAAIALLPAGR